MNSNAVKPERFAHLSELVGEPVFSAAEAGAIINKTKPMVLRMVRSGTIKASRIGRDVAIRASALRELVAA